MTDCQPVFKTLRRHIIVMRANNTHITYAVLAFNRQQIPARFRVSSLAIACNSLVKGLGFSLLPCGLGDADLKLTRIDSAYIEPHLDFWLLSHIDLRTTARIRIFRDFMLESIKPYIPLLEGKMAGAELPKLQKELGLS